MFLMGVVSIFQIAFLPGYLLLRLLRLNNALIKTLILSFSCSIVINYFIVLFLVVFNIYNKTSLSTIICIEVLLFIMLSRDFLMLSLLDFGAHCKKKLSDMACDLRSNTSAIYLLAMSAMIFPLGYFLYKFIINIGGVIDGWDAVISWNNWAIDWYSGQLPSSTRHYPQLIPANWSLTYVLIGNSKVQFFASFIMPLFPLFTLLALFDLWKRHKQSVYAVAVLVTAALYIGISYTYINKSYVDIPVSSMAFISLYVLLLLDHNMTVASLYKHISVGVMCCIGAALTKQTGLYMLLFYPLMTYFYVSVSTVISKIKLHKLIIVSSFFLVAIASHWYVYAEVKIAAGSDVSEIKHLTNDIHNETDMVARYVKSIHYLADTVTNNVQLFFWSHNETYTVQIRYVVVACMLAAVCLIVFALRNRKARILVAMVVPAYFIWSLFLSYDLRNIVIIIPFCGLVLSHGSAEMVNLCKIYVYKCRGEL